MSKWPPAFQIIVPGEGAPSLSRFLRQGGDFDFLSPPNSIRLRPQARGPHFSTLCPRFLQNKSGCPILARTLRKGGQHTARTMRFPLHTARSESGFSPNYKLTH
jgi:hypothetical protein